MGDERQHILKQVAEGTISPEEADKLLASVGKDKVPTGGSDPDTTPGKLKYLRVTIDSAKGDKVKVRIPLALIRAGITLAALLPEDVSEKIATKGIDLTSFSRLDSDELIEALRELEVDIDSADGDTVRIFCE